jgi:hypothetical protein
LPSQTFRKMNIDHLIKKEYLKAKGLTETVKTGNGNQIIRILSERNKEENKTCFKIDRSKQQNSDRRAKR